MSQSTKERDYIMNTGEILVAAGVQVWRGAGHGLLAGGKPGAAAQTLCFGGLPGDLSSGAWLLCCAVKLSGALCCGPPTKAPG